MAHVAQDTLVITPQTLTLDDFTLWYVFLRIVHVYLEPYKTHFSAILHSFNRALD